MKNEYIKIANTSFHIESVSKLTLKDFQNTYKGQLNYDLNLAYEQIQKKAGKLNPSDETSVNAKTYPTEKIGTDGKIEGATGKRNKIETKRLNKGAGQ